MAGRYSSSSSFPIVLRNCVLRIELKISLWKVNAMPPMTIDCIFVRLLGIYGVTITFTTKSLCSNDHFNTIVVVGVVLTCCCFCRAFRFPSFEIQNKNALVLRFWYNIFSSFHRFFFLFSFFCSTFSVWFWFRCFFPCFFFVFCFYFAKYYKTFIFYFFCLNFQRLLKTLFLSYQCVVVLFDFVVIVEDFVV